MFRILLPRIEKFLKKLASHLRCNPREDVLTGPEVCKADHL